jgi:hypothetical protein
MADVADYTAAESPGNLPISSRQGRRERFN